MDAVNRWLNITKFKGKNKKIVKERENNGTVSFFIFVNFIRTTLCLRPSPVLTLSFLSLSLIASLTVCFSATRYLVSSLIYFKILLFDVETHSLCLLNYWLFEVRPVLLLILFPFGSQLTNE